MIGKLSLSIIIPAFNEEKKLDVQAFRMFLSAQKQVFFVFVNDSSTDKTLSIIEEICIGFEEKTFIISNKQNVGKAQSVRNGINYALQHNKTKKYAFLDADLATSLDECLLISTKVNDVISFSFGSRILTIDSEIKRKAYRHYIGRVIATAISNVLKLEVYDTQCGCKVFSQKLAEDIFQEIFISKWLFDVELFFRILKKYGRKDAIGKMHEHPLKKWIDKGESKVKFTYIFKLWVDLWRIKMAYSEV